MKNKYMYQDIILTKSAYHIDSEMHYQGLKTIKAIEGKYILAIILQIPVYMIQWLEAVDNVTYQVHIEPCNHNRRRNILSLLNKTPIFMFYW